MATKVAEQMKSQLEWDIADMINEFNSETGTKLQKIDLDYNILTGVIVKAKANF